SSAAVTIGATISAVLLLALVLFLVFFKRHRDQGIRTRFPHNATLFEPGTDEAKDGLMDKQQQVSSSNQLESSQSPSMSLPPLDESAGTARPLVPRLTIPGSADFLKTAFKDPYTSAVSSACMDSADSSYSHFSAAGQSGTMHVGPSRAFPILSGPHNSTASDVTAGARPLITAARPQRSLHPVSGTHLITGDASRMRMDSIMELPSPFIFASRTESESPPQRDSMPVSPMSKLSEELDSFIETIPAPRSAEQGWSEISAPVAYGVPASTYASDGHVSPLLIRKNGARGKEPF
ncbi:hypothetical protein B0H16DRAFT_1597939, partial [Mycena metata]